MRSSASPDNLKTQTLATGQFNLSTLSPQARQLINLAASNQAILDQFVKNPAAAWAEFGSGIDGSERRTLELIAAIFLPSTSELLTPKIIMDGLWTQLPQ